MLSKKIYIPTVTAMLVFTMALFSTNQVPPPDFNGLKENLYRHVDFLSHLDPPRDFEYIDSLNRAARYIDEEFAALDLKVSKQIFHVDQVEYRNIIASYGDTDLPVVVVGAHYDVCGDQPGADDNASAVAGLLELARLVSINRPQLPWRIVFVAYSLEEPPHFATDSMGSFVHARSLREESVDVKLMICLEMIGYYSDQKDSQNYPSPLLNLIYPDQGNFIAVVGRFEDNRFLRKIKRAMKHNSEIDVRSLAAPADMIGIDFSDHRNYWAHKYNAVMITDTAFYRNPHYHQESDTIDTLNFDKMSEVIKGLYGALFSL